MVRSENTTDLLLPERIFLLFDIGRNDKSKQVYLAACLDWCCAAERSGLSRLERRLNRETRAIHSKTSGGERSEEKNKVEEFPVPHASKDSLANRAEADGIAADLKGEHEEWWEGVLEERSTLARDLLSMSSMKASQ